MVGAKLVDSDASPMGHNSYPTLVGYFEGPELPDWKLTLTLRSDHEHVAVTEFCLTYHGDDALPQRTLTKTALVGIKLAELIDELRRPYQGLVIDEDGMAEQLLREGVASEVPAFWKEAVDLGTAWIRNAWSRPQAGVKRTGQHGFSDKDYAEFALMYVQACVDPDPIASLARRLHLSRAGVKARVARCRSPEVAMLTPPPAPRRAGGELTQKAKDLLDGPRPKA